jgi:hypothetical protein
MSEAESGASARSSIICLAVSFEITCVIFLDYSPSGSMRSFSSPSFSLSGIPGINGQGY